MMKSQGMSRRQVVFLACDRYWTITSIQSKSFVCTLTPPTQNTVLTDSFGAVDPTCEQCWCIDGRAAAHAGHPGFRSHRALWQRRRRRRKSSAYPLAQSAKQLRKIETDLNVRLFHREGRALKLTSWGRALLSEGTHGIRSTQARAAIAHSFALTTLHRAERVALARSLVTAASARLARRS